MCVGRESGPGKYAAAVAERREETREKEESTMLIFSPETSGMSKQTVDLRAVALKVDEQLTGCK